LKNCISCWNTILHLRQWVSFLWSTSIQFINILRKVFSEFHSDFCFECPCIFIYIYLHMHLRSSLGRPWLHFDCQPAKDKQRQFFAPIKGTSMENGCEWGDGRLWALGFGLGTLLPCLPNSLKRIFFNGQKFAWLLP